MRIDKLPSAEEFIIREFDFHGEKLTLVNPLHAGINWTADNLHFRSSIWDKDGYLVSAGFKKFFNLNEKPDIEPWDGNLEGAECVTKLDGSLLIVSPYRGKNIIRTRGSFDYSKQPNADEVEYFIKKGQLKLGRPYMEEGYSYLFEWQSPKHQIVIKHTKPVLSLIGIVDHWHYSYSSQKSLTTHCELFGGSRPTVHRFTNKEHLLNEVLAFSDLEGVCLYYNNGQSIRKIKSTWYLKLHAFKSECSVKSVTQLYLENKRPSKVEFREIIESTFDYECLVMATPMIESLYKEAVAPVEEATKHILQFCEDNKNLEQKDFATKLIAMNLGQTDLAAIGFSYRKGIDYDKNIDRCILNRMGL